MREKIFFYCLFALFLGGAYSASAQEMLKGKIVDASQKPLAGVSVRVVGDDSRSASSGADGEFSVSVNVGETLQLSSVEYESQHVVVKSLQPLTLTMRAKDEVLDEVVVIGYGTQRRSDVIAPVSKFNAEGLEERPLVRVDQALIGQVSGVRVKQTTGIPGKGLSVQVRGSGSITAGTEPLYVIDGFPLGMAAQNGSGNYAQGSPLDNINPNDIESIEVLKDAASAAIYGSRAANGVVLITTKRGKTGQPQISFNTYLGASSPYRKLDMLNGEEWIDRAVEMINSDWVVSGAGRTATQTMDERRAILGLNPGAYNTAYMYDERWLQDGRPGIYTINWQDEAYRTGLVQNYQLGASGGTEYVNYYISGNYMDQKGIVRGVDYKNYALRANVDVKPTKKLTLGMNLAPTYSEANDPGVEGKDNIIHQIYSMTPIQTNPVGTVNVFENDKYPWSTSTNDPIAKLENYLGENKTARMLATLYGQYNILNNLVFKTTVNLDHTDRTAFSFRPYTVGGTLPERTNRPNFSTYGSSNKYRKQTFVNENTLTYNLELDKHNLTALLGHAYNYDRFDGSTITSQGGYTNSNIKTLNAAVGTTATSTATKNLLLSYFGRVQYAFDGKYLVSASVRRDGSSRFGTNTKWGWFPSLSAGWRISDESFMKSAEFIQDLKIRGSYGESGNNNIGDYSGIAVLNSANYSWAGATAPGWAPGNIINPDLTWEKSRTFDLGLDFALFRSRLSGSFDWYQRTSSNLLLNVPTMWSTGFGSLLDNAGEVRSRGWDLEITSRNLQRDNFSWSTSFNLSHNTNKVTQLVGNQQEILIPSSFDIEHSILRVGEPMYSIYVVQQDGILTQQDIDNGAAVYGNQVAGDPRYVDANGDKVIDANDRVIVGHPNPDYVWGITNDFRYKNFDLSFMFQGQNGGHLYSLLGRALGRTGQGASDNALGFYRDRWRSAEDPGEGRVGKASSTFGRIKNTDWLYSSDYWRLRNVTFGYNFRDLRLAGQSWLNSGRVYLTLENFWGKDKYDGGLNPESANTNLSGSSVFSDAGDYGGLALPKTVTFGINLTF
ncbi:SusC/RagA family TonB-linked outer membrane protein [Sphingobacterium chuzhouense]|uniref:TonB-dependent receptor n=1 Tax=Sphingobacterium chuzhouense TaxID=1742264 RepID=A0ABR7XMT5_9SPHI|nr:TonB-dependent receptor [Sphingobacterium chuzhouense]MBD1420488.1 TonB-dependent receptor [Sphingobacterium chuzhouense]